MSQGTSSASFVSHFLYKKNFAFYKLYFLRTFEEEGYESDEFNIDEEELLKLCSWYSEEGNEEGMFFIHRVTIKY